MADLSGRVAIITGASRGIGEAIAQALARAGAAVVVSSRKLENVGRVAEEIRAMGGHALGVEAHAGRAADASAIAEAALAEYGRVDILVNNAGTNPHFGPMLTAEESHWDKIFEVNVKGQFYMVKAVVPAMIRQGGGKVINIASIAGVTPGP